MKKIIKQKKSKKSNSTSSFFILGKETPNNQYIFGIRKNNEVVELGLFSEGLTPEENNALTEIIMKNKKASDGSIVKIDPSICVELEFTSVDKVGNIINPVFKRFRTDLHWEDCTWGQLILDISTIHKEVHMTNPNKPVWGEPFVNKERFITYLHDISPHMLPYLRNKILTVIRFPHGVDGEAFYQKNSPDYAPPFIHTYEEDGINFIHCKDLSTLLWLGNQLALEYHVPFQPIGRDDPTEIVFDLDPPSVEYFSLAVKAAREMYQMLEKFNITSFPKLSGNKGLQIHIPVFQSSITYEDARILTSFMAHYLVEKHPEDFTVERMKKNRGNRLYIDYLQHWHGKTIICPYSTRGKEGAKVAAPLFWEEVNETLEPSEYTIFSMIDRIEKLGCPWSGYFEEENEAVREIITSLKKQK